MYISTVLHKCYCHCNTVAANASLVKDCWKLQFAAFLKFQFLWLKFSLTPSVIDVWWYPFCCITLYGSFYFFYCLHIVLEHVRFFFFPPQEYKLFIIRALLHHYAQWLRRHFSEDVIALHPRTNRDFPPDSSGISPCFDAPCHLLFCLSLPFVMWAV